MAARPLASSENFGPMDGDKKPGNLQESGVMYPVEAYMGTRPCSISVTRRRLMVSTWPSLL
eukprot:8474378-Heterocapsa_arctica.AAC.1